MKLSEDRIKSIKEKCERNQGWYATRKYHYNIDTTDQRLRRISNDKFCTTAALEPTAWEYMEGDTEPRWICRQWTKTTVDGWQSEFERFFTEADAVAAGELHLRLKTRDDDDRDYEVYKER